MNIPKEAVEAAAKAHWEYDAGVSWDEHTTDDYRGRMHESMSAALEAAAAHMLAGVSTLDDLVMLEPGVVLQGPDFHEETYKCTAPGTFHAIASPTEYRASELVSRGPFTIIYRKAAK